MSALNIKHTLRQQYRAKRNALTAQEQLQHAEAILKNLQTLQIFQSANHLGVYLATDAEVNTQNIIRYLWSQQQTIALPVIAADKPMDFYSYEQNIPLKKNNFAIEEPDITHQQVKQLTNSLKCLLIPMVAFNKQGYRLGFGGGYYDKFLDSVTHTPICIGLAHQIQKTNENFQEKWDKKMHYIVTEEKIYQFSK